LYHLERPPQERLLQNTSFIKIGAAIQKLCPKKDRHNKLRTSSLYSRSRTQNFELS